MRSTFGALLFVLAAGSASSARADRVPMRATLVWEAPSDCVPADALRREIEARLGRPVFVDPGDVAQADARAEIRIANAGERRIATVSLWVDDRRVGERVLESREADCRALDASLALVVAIVVDLDREELAEMEAVAASTPLALPPEPEAPPMWAVRGAISARGSVDLVPGASPGVAIEVSALLPGAPILVALRYTEWLERDAAIDGRGVAIAARSGDLLGGIELYPVGGVRVALSIGAGAVQWRARGIGVSSIRTAETLRAALLAEARLEVDIALPLVLFVEVGAAFPLFRDRFGLNRDPYFVEVFSPGVAIPQAGLGLAIRVP